jgi:MFS family permease
MARAVKAPQTTRVARTTFAALSHRNYRLWFFGQMTSLFGTWMQSTAQGYLMFELTRSAAWLGYTGFASGLGMWLFTLYGGVIADRVPRRSLLVITPSLSMGLALVLSALTFTHLVAPWHIIVLAFLLGVVNAFDVPARHSFVIELVGTEDMTNAIALNSMMFNAAVAVGPAIGGQAYALFGPGWCFAINAVSFLAVIAALAGMRMPPFRRPAQRASVIADIRAGARVVRATPGILALIVLVGSVSIFGMTYTTLMPAWAVRVLRGDARTNGLLQSARGIGAFAAALAIASLGRFRWRGRLLAAGSFLFPVMLVAFSFTRALPLSLAALLLVGASNITINSLANSLVQTWTPDEVRGRVMSIYNMFFMGLMPVGSLLAGAIAERGGEPLAVLVGAVGTLACATGIRLAVPSLRKAQ